MKKDHHNKQKNLALEKAFLNIRLAKTLKKWQKQVKKSNQRLFILKQWTQTQKSYMRDLKIIQQQIQKPLLQHNLINDSQDRTLFPNLKSMVDLSTKLNEEITKFISTFDSNKTMIGQILASFHKFFMIYRQYCNNFLKSQQIMKQVKKNPQAQKIQEKLKMDFESYIIKPVQRPPKYQLLLRQYLKNLYKSHPDYSYIEDAYQKYHDVNETNNQSMDRQIRDDIMVNLQHKFGNIVSNRSGRVYLKQFEGTCLEGPSRVYLFNDLLLIIKRMGDESQLIRRVELDGNSYVRKRMDNKYYFNNVFVCGETMNFHIWFNSPADCNNFYQKVYEVVELLHKKDYNKRIIFNQLQTKRRNLSKIKVLKYRQKKQSTIYNPKIMISVEGIVREQDDILYATKYQLMPPLTSSQTVYHKIDDILSIQTYLSTKYRQLYIAKFFPNPQNAHIYDIKLNKTKILEYRALIVEQYLNYLFRFQEIYGSWKVVAQKLKLNNELFRVSISQDYGCDCQKCVEVKLEGSWDYYWGVLERVRAEEDQANRLSMAVNLNKKSSNQSMISKDKYYSLDSCLPKNPKCPFQVFHLYSKISNTPSSHKNLTQTFLKLSSKLGRIEYSLLFPSPNLTNQYGIFIKILFNAIKEESIKICLSKELYIGEVMEEVRVRNGLKCLDDFGIFWGEFGEKLVGWDQKILEFVKDHEIQYEQNLPKVKEESFFVFKKFDQIKKWGNDLLSKKKSHLLLKKYIHLPAPLQLQGCKQNKQRYHYILMDIFARFRSGKLLLPIKQIISLCSVFYLRQQFNRIQNYTRQDFNKQLLNGLMADNYRYLLDFDNFQEEMFKQLMLDYNMIITNKNEKNAIQVIYDDLLTDIFQNEEYYTTYFTGTSYEQSSYFDQGQQIYLGINYSQILIKKHNSSIKLLFVDLKDLRYKVSIKSVYFWVGQTCFRFDTEQGYQIRRLIQIYRTFRSVQGTLDEERSSLEK